MPNDYKIAVRAVTFSNGSTATAGTRTISFSLNDGAAVSNIATKQISVQKNNALLAGDFTLDGHVNGADVSAMIVALADLNAFKTNHSLSAADLLAVGDVNHNGSVTNADLQSLLSLLASGGGSGASSSEASSTVSSTSAAADSETAAATTDLKLGTLIAPISSAVPKTAAPIKPILTTPAIWLDANQPSPLTPAVIDQALRATNAFRSRHISWGPSKPDFNDGLGL